MAKFKLEIAEQAVEKIKKDKEEADRRAKASEEKRQQAEENLRKLEDKRKAEEERKERQRVQEQLKMSYLYVQRGDQLHRKAQELNYQNSRPNWNMTMDQWKASRNSGGFGGNLYNPRQNNWPVPKRMNL